MQVSTAISISIAVLPVLASFLIYKLDTFEPASLDYELKSRNGATLSFHYVNSRILNVSEKIGYGQLYAPEDIAYDEKSGFIYTGTVDGWINRVSLDGSKVERWVNTGGRPLGLAHGPNRELIVADADKGLLNISSDGVIELLTDEAEGVKFKLTDAVDIGRDGKLYFSDATYKYSFKDHILDLFEGRPHGRLLSYDPSTKETKVLIRDLYFANGVVVSPDQSYVIICETAMMRCKKYYIEGERKGSVDMFVENLPGPPDNIRYDGEGRYWIALSMDKFLLDLIQRYPFIRKVFAILEKSTGRPKVKEGYGGAVAVDLHGKPIAYYYDPNEYLVSSSIKIGDHLYFGSVIRPYILRLNLTQYPAPSTA